MEIRSIARGDALCTAFPKQSLITTRWLQFLNPQLEPYQTEDAHVVVYPEVVCPISMSYASGELEVYNFPTARVLSGNRDCIF